MKLDGESANVSVNALRNSHLSCDDCKWHGKSTTERSPWSRPLISSRSQPPRRRPIEWSFGQRKRRCARSSRSGVAAPRLFPCVRCQAKVWRACLGVRALRSSPEWVKRRIRKVNQRMRGPRLCRTQKLSRVSRARRRARTRTTRIWTVEGFRWWGLREAKRSTRCRPWWICCVAPVSRKACGVACNSRRNGSGCAQVRCTAR
jgi:hypothetical protein